MNNKAETRTAVIVVVIAVILLVIILLGLTPYGKKFIQFAKSLARNDTQARVEDFQRLHYSLAKDEVEYYDGNEWLGFKGKNLEMDDKMISYDQVYQTFVNYYYGANRKGEFKDGKKIGDSERHATIKFAPEENALSTTPPAEALIDNGTINKDLTIFYVHQERYSWLNLQRGNKPLSSYVIATFVDKKYIINYNNKIFLVAKEGSLEPVEHLLTNPLKSPFTFPTKLPSLKEYPEETATHLKAFKGKKISVDVKPIKEISPSDALNCPQGKEALPKTLDLFPQQGYSLQFKRATCFKEESEGKEKYPLSAQYRMVFKGNPINLYLIFDLAMYDSVKKQYLMGSTRLSAFSNQREGTVLEEHNNPTVFEAQLANAVDQWKRYGLAERIKIPYLIKDPDPKKGGFVPSSEPLDVCITQIGYDLNVDLKDPNYFCGEYVNE
jgi:hypothetical protein